MYATITVFKQLDHFRARTSDNPIMLGPILLSTNATEETNKYFLTHLKWRLHQEELPKVMVNEDNFDFGSHQEKTLINAIISVFPTATRFLCVYHIRKIIRDPLRKLSVVLLQFLFKTIINIKIQVFV